MSLVYDGMLTRQQTDELVNLLHEKINSVFIGSLPSVHQVARLDRLNLADIYIVFSSSLVITTSL